MKKILMFAILLLPIFAQNNNIIFSLEGSNLIPLGEFSKRFKSTYGGAFLVGYNEKDWDYFAKFEYFKFDKPNYSQLYLKKKVTISTIDERVYKIPLPNIKHNFEAFGISFNPRYNLVKSDFVNAKIEISAGFINWKYNRDAYDTIKVDTSSVSGVNKFLILESKVPKASQMDWSGFANIGFNADFIITENILFTVSTTYKLIATELWPALSLGMENVSALQMFEIRAGVKIKLE